jgi:hypothetical protein
VRVAIAARTDSAVQIKSNGLTVRRVFVGLRRLGDIGYAEAGVVSCLCLPLRVDRVIDTGDLPALRPGCTCDKRTDDQQQGDGDALEKTPIH